MVRIVDYKERTSEDGNSFFTLQLEGDMEMVRSQETGNYYATARKASITSTFNEATCLSIIGKELPGAILKVVCDPYEHTLKDTGEVIELTHKYVYEPDEEISEKQAPSELEVNLEEFNTNGIPELV